MASITFYVHERVLYIVEKGFARRVPSQKVKPNKSRDTPREMTSAQAPDGGSGNTNAPDPRPEVFEDESTLPADDNHAHGAACAGEEVIKVPTIKVQVVALVARNLPNVAKHSAEAVGTATMKQFVDAAVDIGLEGSARMNPCFGVRVSCTSAASWSTRPRSRAARRSSFSIDSTTLA